jgi:hypothetical protein
VGRAIPAHPWRSSLDLPDTLSACGVRPRPRCTESREFSGEHGIGNKRKQYMRYSVGEVSLDLMKRVKKALDPNDILNPGKIFE